MSPLFVQNRNVPVEVSEFENEWLVLNLIDFSVVKLDQLAGVCWNFLQEAQSIPVLVERVIHYFSWPQDYTAVLEDTIHQQINNLLEYELIYYVS